MPTFDAIERAYLRIIEPWGLDLKAMPYGTTPTDDGGSHIEILPEGGMALVATERGKEIKRRETRDIDELLYWILEAHAHARAWKYEMAHRHPTQDSRRIVFPKAMEEVGKLSPAWRDRMESELNRILRTHPHNDRTA